MRKPRGSSYGALQGRIRRGGGSGEIAFAELWSRNALSLCGFFTTEGYPQAELLCAAGGTALA
jgi:hypothetical protein